MQEDFLFNNARGYTDEETPCSISNQEAKLVMADDTISYWDRESRSLRALLKFIQSLFLNYLLFLLWFFYLYSKILFALLAFYLD